MNQHYNQHHHYKFKKLNKLALGEQFYMKHSENENILTSSVWQVGSVRDVVLPHGVHDGPESVEWPGVEHVLKEVSTFTSSLGNQRHQVVGNFTKNFTMVIHHLPKKLDCVRFVKQFFDKAFA